MADRCFARDGIALILVLGLTSAPAVAGLSPVEIAEWTAEIPEGAGQPGIDPAAVDIDRSASSDAPVETPACVPHPPIFIDERVGPNGFEWINPATGEQEPRPGSGVVGGPGTAADPYVIEGWCIEQPFSSRAGIWIETTDAHVVIEGNVLAGRPHPVAELTLHHPDQTGVLLDRVLNVQVQENTFLQNWGPGIVVLSSSDTRIEANRFQDNRANGIHLGSSNDIVIARNAFTENDGIGVSASDSQDLTIRENVLRGNFFGGFHLSGVDHSLVGGNTLLGPFEDITVSDRSDGNVIRDNTIKDVEGRGILLWAGSTRNLIESNEITRAEGAGVAVWSPNDQATEGNTVRDNVISAGEDVGVFLRVADGNRIVSNRITDHERDGVYLKGASDRNVIEGNVIRANQRDGIRTVESGPFSTAHGNRIAQNTIQGNGDAGIHLASAANTSLLENNITRNTLGVAVEGSIGSELHRNNIWANRGSGLDVQNVTEPVNATRNWWGCPSGPDEPACDGVEGDAIVEPWLTEPNRQAGASG